MKRLWYVLLITCSCLFLVACSNNSSTAKIETSKSGKINTTIYSQEEVKKGKVEITPLLKTDDKEITDDGKGLYCITLLQDGAGSVTIPEEKVQAGTTVTVNATPDNDWKIVSYVLDDQIVQSNSFVMPEHDVTFKVIFQNKKHNVDLAGYGDESWIIRNSGPDCVEGETFYFSILMGDDSFRYYEYEDIFVRSSSYNEQGEYTNYQVTKINDNDYSFIMPENDCVIGCNTHEYGKILEIIVKDKDYNTIGYINKDENQASDYIDLTMSIDGKSFSVGEYAKRVQAIITINNLNPLYQIEYITTTNYGSYEGHEATKIDDTHYSFDVVYGYLYVFLKDYEIPKGTYNVNCLDTQNGSLQVDVAYAAPGETVTVTATPDEGYYLAKLQYVVGDSNEYVDIERIEDIYSFVMPEGEVNIKATFISVNQVEGYIRIIYDWTEEEMTIEQLQLEIEIVYINEEYINQPYSENITNDLVLYFENGSNVELRLHYKDMYTVKSVTYSSTYSLYSAMSAVSGGTCDCVLNIDGSFMLEIHIR